MSNDTLFISILSYAGESIVIIEVVCIFGLMLFTKHKPTKRDFWFYFSIVSLFITMCFAIASEIYNQLKYTKIEDLLLKNYCP